VGLKGALSQPYTNEAISFGLRRQMTAWLELYAQYGHERNYDPQNTSYSSFSVTVPANAPGNPFGQAVKVQGQQTNDSGAAYFYNTITQSFSTGAKFTLPHDWKADVNYSWGLTGVTVDNFRSLDATSLAAAVTNGSLNLITDVSRYPFAASAYPSTTVFYQGTSVNALQLKAVGPLMHLWAGAPLLALGVEHQESGGKGGYQDLKNPVAATTPGVATTATVEQYAYWPGGSITDNSAYAELTLPLVNRANKIPFVKLLDLQVAARDDFDKDSMVSPIQNITVTRVDGTKTYSPALLTGGPEPFTLSSSTYSSLNKTVGLKYKPLESLFFRWSYSTAFIPPTYSQLTTPISTGTITQTTGAYPGVPTTSPWSYQSITDTQLGNAVYTVPVITGGNPNLKPETSKGLNWGVVLEPTFLKGLRISLDYSKVAKFNDIITPSPATLIPYADSFPGRVVRGTPNAGQTVGPIVLIDDTYINAPSTSTSAYNLKLDYTLGTSLGRWDLSAVATTLQHYRLQSTIGGLSVEQLSNPNATTTGTSPAIAKFKGNMSLDWTKGHFTAGWLARYVGPYTDGSRYGIGGAFPTQGTVNGWVSSQIYHDAYVGYKLGKAGLGDAWWRKALADTSVQLGVRNIFNKIPPYDAVAGANGLYNYSTYGDIRLASYYFTFKKAF
jgi:outer membrane receptor protein involved in Fe transport